MYQKVHYGHNIFYVLKCIVERSMSESTSLFILVVAHSVSTEYIAYVTMFAFSSNAPQSTLMVRFTTCICRFIVELGASKLHQFLLHFLFAKVVVDILHTSQSLARRQSITKYTIVCGSQSSAK